MAILVWAGRSCDNSSGDIFGESCATDKFDTAVSSNGADTYSKAVINSELAWQPVITSRISPPTNSC